MNELKVFNIGGVECYEKDGIAYLKLETVARGLGFIKTDVKTSETGFRKEYVRIDWPRVDRYLKDLSVSNCGHDGFIPENIFYRLAMKAKNAAAEAFQAKVADEVLPMIRKTGGYVNNDDLFINTYLSSVEEPVKQLFRVTLKVLRNQNQIINSQNQQLIEQKPKVEFADCVGSSKDLLTIGQFSKLVHDENIPVGRNRLFKWMRDKGYLRKNNEPYQQYIDSGFFKVKEGAKQNQYSSKLFTVTLITGKGQIYFAEKLRNEFVSQSVS